MPGSVDVDIHAYIPLEGTFDLALDAYDRVPDRELFEGLTYVYDNDRNIPGRGNRPVLIDDVFRVVTVERWEDQEEYNLDQELVSFRIPVEAYIAGYPVLMESSLRTPAADANFARDAPKWGETMGMREVAMAFRPLARNDMAYTGKSMFTTSFEPHHHPAGGGFFHNRYSPQEALGPTFDINNVTPWQAAELANWAQTQLAANQTRENDDEAVYSTTGQRLLIIVNNRDLFNAFAPLQQRSMLIVENDQGSMVRDENPLQGMVTVRYIPSFGQGAQRRIVFRDLDSPWKPVVFIDDIPLQTGIFQDKNLPNGYGKAGARRFMGAGNLWPQGVLDVFDAGG